MQTTFRPAPSTGAFTQINAALALCAAVLTGTPGRLEQVRRLSATADADLLRSGRTRDAETRRIFGDWFGF